MNKLKRIGCLHAHHSNIRYVEEAFSGAKVELLHFVDPGMIYRLTGGEESQKNVADKLQDQLNWIAGCGVDAAVITCTNYIAALDLVEGGPEQWCSVPVIPIDEPWFDEVLKLDREVVLAFTNPATVDGTMDRLKRYAAHRSIPLRAETAVAEDCFRLLMLGQTEAYSERVEQYLLSLIEAKGESVVVTQLSMTDAAERVERSLGIELVQPMRALYSKMMS